MPRLLFSAWVLAVLAGCAVTMQHPPAITTLPALQVSAQVLITPQQALAEGDTLALLALNAEMREFVDLYVRGVVNPRSRLELLHSSLRSGALHGLEYDPDADGSAQLAFESGQANCLAYANLFVAMARYAGLNANYQLLTLRPYFSRFGTRVAVEQHVNVQVRLRDRSLYSVDLDPPPRDAITHTRKLADKDAFALYYNNLAMQQLQNEELKSAFTQILQALVLSPRAH